MAQINYEYLSKLRPINGNSEEFDDPLSRESTDARRVKSLGFSGSNSGNVSDFDNPDSELSRGTASILQNMRLQKEARKSKQSMPESEKLFLVEMRRRKAKEDAKNYMDMRKVEQKDELINLKKMEIQQSMAETMADREEKERTKQIDANKAYIGVLNDTGQEDTPEARQAFNSAYYNGVNSTQQDNTAQQETITPQTATDQNKTMTAGQKFGFGKKKNSEMTLNQTVNAAQNLSNKFTSSELYKKFEELNDYSEKTKAIQEELSKGKSANYTFIDTALGYIFNKSLDPGSVVREGEFDRAFAGQPLLNKLKGKFQQIIDGGMGLDEESRNELMKMVPFLLQSTKSAIKNKYNKILKPQIEEYQKRGIDINDRMIIGDFADYLGEEQGQPQGQPTSSETRTKMIDGKAVTFTKNPKTGKWEA